MTNQPIKFCHIAPTRTLEYHTKTNGAHLILAHLVEQDQMYADHYANLRDGKPKILDNSAFELYKQGLPMFDPSKLIELGKKVNANYIVLPDYPGEPGEKTIEAAQEYAPQFDAAGFYTFFVPQSRVGDLQDYIDCMQWAINNPEINLIGLSILGVPNAFGVEKDNNLQRYLSRLHMLDILAARGVLDIQTCSKRFHCLGMVDGPNEIRLLKDYHDLIFSWDSSSAVWAGLNEIAYDNSPTGLVNGKFEKEVNFAFDASLMTDLTRDITNNNISYIDLLISRT